VTLTKSESFTTRELRKALRTGKLKLSDRGLTEVPPEIGQLTNLKTLDLSGNQLTAPPPEIGQLINLQTLNLSGNQLTALPPEIGQLTYLQWLYLYDNRLTVLPPEIGQLTDLQRLGLSGNQLTALPPEIGQLDLEWLSLYRNQLTALPPEIGQLTYLQWLYLYDNRLTVLPPEIGQLIYLRRLDLSGNQLTALPPEIGQLTNLKTLDLSGNQLTALPEIGQLTRLQTLNFSNNKLRMLPPKLGGLLTGGLEIRLDGNPLRRRIRELSPRKLGAYLRSLDSSGHQAVMPDRWSSQDSRTLFITIVGTFVATVATVLYVGVALIFAHRSSKTEIAGQLGITGYSLFWIVLFIISYLWTRTRQKGPILPRWILQVAFWSIAILLLMIALYWVGKAAGIK
jgi:Leucine-rich repeat (LRR) protein